MVRNPPANAGDRETQVLSLGQEDPLQEEMATHSGILAWRIPWAEEPGGLQSMGSQESDATACTPYAWTQVRDPKTSFLGFVSFSSVPKPLSELHLSLSTSHKGSKPNPLHLSYHIYNTAHTSASDEFPESVAQAVLSVKCPPRSPVA